MASAEDTGQTIWSQVLPDGSLFYDIKKYLRPGNDTVLYLEFHPEQHPEFDMPRDLLTETVQKLARLAAEHKAVVAFVVTPNAWLEDLSAEEMNAWHLVVQTLAIVNTLWPRCCYDVTLCTRDSDGKRIDQACWGTYNGSGEYIGPLNYSPGEYADNCSGPMADESGPDSAPHNDCDDGN